MEFYELLEQVQDLLRRRGRVSYRALKVQFNLDDDHLAALQDELIDAQRLASDEDGKVLVWTGDAAPVPPAREAEPAPLAYTPPYLTEKILTSRSALEGGRKQVTVLFADLKGSTELIRDLDPEQARSILDPALHAMMEAVHRYEGMVNQVLGDGIMALFGAPLAHEDHAARAYYAALAMQDALRRYAEEVRRTHGLTVQMRVGLNSGEVVVRAIGNDLHMDYSAVGLTTVLAARMEQLATPGSILLTAATLRLVEGLGQVNPLGPVPVKGVDEPVAVFELVGASAIRRRLQAAVARGLTRFVGRQAVLAARIDRLPPEEKRLLQTAAVLGMEVPLALLQAIAELSEETLYRGLTHLQAAEFLYETRLFPEHAYTFKHALTHEVAYRSLLQERRRVLHMRIVEALEALASDRLADQVERLADHAFRGEVWDKALVYCRQAGAKAMERSASRETVGCYEQALAALEHLPEQRELREQAIDLRFDLRSARIVLGQHERALHDLRAAETLAEALDDQRRLGRVSLYMVDYFLVVGQYDRAIASSQRALALAAASGDTHTPVVANNYLGMVYFFQGDYRQAMAACRRAVAALEGERRYERFGQPVLPAVQSRTFLSRCLAEVGAFAEGIAVGEAGLRIAEAFNHPVSLVTAYRGVGQPYLHQGNLHQALPVLERAVGLCEEAELPFHFSLLAPALGSAYMLCGRVDEAVRLLERALEQATSSGRMGGQAHLRAGRLEAAHTLAARALEHARTYQERGDEAYVLRLLGDLATHRHPPQVEEAEASYCQAMALAEALGMHPLAAHCHLGLGNLYLKLGRREQARADLSQALELFRAMQMTFWLPAVEVALAQVVKEDEEQV